MVNQVNQIKINIIKSITIVASMSILGGVLYIPILIENLGYIITLLYVSLGGIVVLILNLMLVEVSLRTSGTKSLVYMTHKYLGNLGKLLSVSIIILIGYFYGWVLFQTASNILVNIFGLNSFIMSIVFLGIVFVFVYLKIYIHTNIQVFLLSIFIFFLLIISGRILLIDNNYYFETINTNNSLTIDNLYLSLGGILFIYFNFLFIQEAEEIVSNSKKFLKNIIIISNSLSILVYISIILIILFSKNTQISENFIYGFRNLVPNELYIIFQFIILGFVLFTFVYLSYYIINTYNSDLNIKKNTSIILSIIPFFGFALLNNIDLIKIMSFTGSLFVSSLGIIITLMFWTAKYKGDTIPEFSLGKMKLGGYFMIFILTLSIFGFIVSSDVFIK